MKEIFSLNCRKFDDLIPIIIYVSCSNRSSYIKIHQLYKLLQLFFIFWWRFYLAKNEWAKKQLAIENLGVKTRIRLGKEVWYLEQKRVWLLLVLFILYHNPGMCLSIFVVWKTMLVSTWLAEEIDTASHKHQIC